MSIISQIGVIILIIGTIFVLIRSNRQLEEAAREGEHFVDEWALRESLKEERKKQISASKEPAHRVFRATRPSFLDQPDSDPESEVELEFDTTQECMPESGSDLTQNSTTRQKPAIKEVNLTLIEPADPQSPGRTIPVRRLPFSIGRAPDNDLVIDDLGVARHHCRIIWKDQLIVMEDAGSRNKIFVNGNPQIRAVLKDNLVIGIGNKEFVVLKGDPTWRRQSAEK